LHWYHVSAIGGRQYTCGYCGNLVGPNSGYYVQGLPHHRIYICAYCSRPTYFDDADRQYPGPAFGQDVASLPNDVEALYREARECISASAFTASVLAARKLLMNIAVGQGASPGLPFIDYVDYLAANGFVPPNGRPWVDHIRRTGNEATHEIALMTQVQAEELLRFIEMLLKFIYEFPALVPPSPQPST
jgi:hypothetical protein